MRLLQPELPKCLPCTMPWQRFVAQVTQAPCSTLDARHVLRRCTNPCLIVTQVSQRLLPEDVLFMKREEQKQGTSDMSKSKSDDDLLAVGLSGDSFTIHCTIGHEVRST